MSAAQHTPGGWYASGDEVLIDMGDRAHLVATVADWSEDTEAYAVLMAAAPDLLAALQQYMAAVTTMNAAMKDGINVHGAMSALVAADNLARAAIAKATGST